MVTLGCENFSEFISFLIHLLKLVSTGSPSQEALRQHDSLLEMCWLVCPETGLCGTRRIPYLPLVCCCLNNGTKNYRIKTKNKKQLCYQSFQCARQSRWHSSPRLWLHIASLAKLWKDSALTLPQNCNWMGQGQGWEAWRCLKDQCCAREQSRCYRHGT